MSSACAEQASEREQSRAEQSKRAREPSHPSFTSARVVPRMWPDHPPITPGTLPTLLHGPCIKLIHIAPTPPLGGFLLPLHWRRCAPSPSPAAPPLTTRLPAPPPGQPLVANLAGCLHSLCITGLISHSTTCNRCVCRAAPPAARSPATALPGRSAHLCNGEPSVLLGRLAAQAGAALTRR